MKRLWIEVKRFIKDHILFLIVGAIAIGIVFVGAVTFLDRGNPNLEEEETEVEREPGEAIPAFFQFFVETPEGEPFANTAIMEQYLRRRQTLQEVGEQTNTDLYEIVEEERALATPQEEWVLAVERNEHSRLHTVTVNIDDDEENLAVAQHYYEMITDGEIPFLANKEVHVFTEPQLYNISDEESVENGETGNDLSIRALAINGTIGLVLGVVVSAGIAVLKALFSKVLKYSFTYTWEETDTFFLYDDSLKNADELSQLLTLPVAQGKIVLSEHTLSEKIKNLFTKNTQVSFEGEQKTSTTLVEKQSLFNIDADLPEVFIVIETNKTSRNWYRKQRRLLEQISVPVSIIQINN